MREFRYGDNKTIHGTTYVDVETDEHGNVTAVWFRCRRLPFKQYRTDAARARDMALAGQPPSIKAIVFEHP